MPDKLSVWNECLRLIKEPLLTDTDGTDKLSLTLRAVMPIATRKCLEGGTWNFAQERRWLNRASETPVAGYQYYLEHPPGWIRTVFISPTGHPEDTLLDYRDEQGMIAANIEKAFMVYVSSKFADEKVGAWSQSFADFVAAEMAVRVAPDLVSASAEQVDDLRLVRRIAKGEAKSFDAQQNPPDRMGRGRWVRAGRGGRGIASRLG